MLINLFCLFGGFFHIGLKFFEIDVVHFPVVVLLLGILVSSLGLLIDDQLALSGHKSIDKVVAAALIFLPLLLLAEPLEHIPNFRVAEFDDDLLLLLFLVFCDWGMPGSGPASVLLSFPLGDDVEWFRFILLFCFGEVEVVEIVFEGDPAE